MKQNLSYKAINLGDKLIVKIQQHGFVCS